MPKNMEMSLLLGYYGEMLSERQKNIAVSYYYDDLTLAEIAENEGITRQGVLDNIRHAEHNLKKFEDVLGFAEKFTDLALIASEIKKIAEENGNSPSGGKLSAIAERITEIIG